MYHPSRGGVRGGADQFEWESVKSDKHRENYLGHSLMAPVGRWQKKKDLQWFSRDKKSASSSKEAEKEAIRRMEADAMAAALGHAPVKRTGTSQLTKQELEEVFKKGQTERDDRDIERVEGMGFGSTRASLMDSGSTKETMSAIGNQIPKNYCKQEDRRDKINTDRKEGKWERKKEKKEKRKKKKKKSSKRSKRHDSPSDSDESDRNAKQDYGRDRHRRGHSNDDKNTKPKSKRARHDSMSDNESDTDRHRRRHSDDDRTTKPKSKRTRHDSTSDNESDTDRHKRRHSDDDRTTKPKSKRTRHDSMSDSESDSRNARKSDLKSKVSKQRRDSTSDDHEPHSKKKHSSDRNKCSKHDRKGPRRQRHDSYSD